MGGLTERTLAQLQADGLCIEEWRDWQQGQCGTYAVALITLNPALRFGGVDFSGEGWPGHFVAFDEHYAYDSAGRHPLPYCGVHGDGAWLGYSGSPEDYGLPEDESGDPRKAVAHAIRNGILQGHHHDTSER